MKAWKKGAILGALWGLVSFIYALIIGFGSMDSGLMASELIVRSGLLLKISVLPIYLTFSILDKINLGILGLFLPILIGVLIGLIVSIFLGGKK